MKQFLNKLLCKLIGHQWITIEIDTSRESLGDEFILWGRATLVCLRCDKLGSFKR